MILPALPGVVVEVHNENSQAFPEHDHELLDSYHNTCGIDVVADQGFTVLLRFIFPPKIPGECFLMRVFVDGIDVDSRVIKLQDANDYLTEGRWNHDVTHLQKMYFSRAAFGDQPTLPVSREKPENFDDIVVALRPGRGDDSKTPSSRLSDSATVSDDGVADTNSNDEILDERLFKARKIDLHTRLYGESKAQRVEVKADVKGGVKGGNDGNIKHEQGTHREEYAPTVTGDNGDDDDVVFLHEHKARKRPRVVIDLEDKEVTPIKGQTKPLKTESTYMSRSSLISLLGLPKTGWTI
ncbi:hypothetical protein B9Z65_3830 [Elsinoe australis]|uniref:Uncharacterized protein n=1 Tax=Elsinoe australis TaxID=40998 RepID=A0A2P8A2N1_9PEZI|nr:hypothetical protein B9Z65_3830 [Elsinoe australis]